MNIDIVLEQLIDIIQIDELHVKCPICFYGLYKTEQCNTIEHCNVEICYACGKIGDCHYNFKLGDHWSEIGINGCPRWDESPIWNNMFDCNFHCSSKCYGNLIGDCSIPEHQDGIHNLITIRKMAHIYHKLKSLLKDIRSDVLQIIKNDERFEEYIPDEAVFNFIEQNIDHYYDFTYYSFINEV